MADRLWLTGDQVIAVFDDDDNSGSAFRFRVIDAGSGPAEAFAIDESGNMEVWGSIESSGGATQVGSTAGSDAVAFQLQGTNVLRVKSGGRLMANVGSRGGVRLKDAQPSNPQGGLAYLDTTNNRFYTYLNGAWKYLS